MANTRQQHDDRARRLAVALASLWRAQSGLSVAAVGKDTLCLRHASDLLALLAQEKPATPLRSAAGRRPVHDRDWAKSALLDFVTTHPDGLVHQAALIRELERRYQCAGKPMPGESWMKGIVRAFQIEAQTFEADAMATYAASPMLRQIFDDGSAFMRWRRAKAKTSQMWHEKPELRAQFETPDKLLEALCYNGFSHSPKASIRAHSRLPQTRKVRAR